VVQKQSTQCAPGDDDDAVYYYDDEMTPFTAPPSASSTPYPDQVGVGGEELHKRLLFIIIPWTKSGLLTSITQTLTGLFSKTHFILHVLSNSVYYGHLSAGE
jgi:hypothetical protein